MFCCVGEVLLRQSATTLSVRTSIHLTTDGAVSFISVVQGEAGEIRNYANIHISIHPSPGPHQPHVVRDAVIQPSR